LYLIYLKFQKKFFYLSAIQDHVSNEIVSFNLSTKHDSRLTLKTIKEAVLKQEAIPNIFHFDRDKENLAEKCIKYLQDLGMDISVSGPASPWQNHIESFFSRFKAESGDMNRFETLEELVKSIYQYINYYNYKRIVTRLKTSPVKYRQSQKICS
jgi:putative transposase